jgi:hypothetical protein
MSTPVTIARWLVRVCGVLLVVLGLLFWLGDVRSLIPLHMLLGIVLVLALWALAYFGARAGINKGLVVGAVVLGLVTAWLGQAQDSLLPDPSVHWLIQVVHLVLGMAAIGLGESMALRIGRAESGALEGRVSQV